MWDTDGSSASRKLPPSGSNEKAGRQMSGDLITVRLVITLALVTLLAKKMPHPAAPSKGGANPGRFQLDRVNTGTI